MSDGIVHDLFTAYLLPSMAVKNFEYQSIFDEVNDKNLLGYFFDHSVHTNTRAPKTTY